MSTAADILLLKAAVATLQQRITRLEAQVNAQQAELSRVKRG